jgi:hypothetical protein
MAIMGGMDIREEVVINAPAPAAWAVLGERFGHIADWAAPITASSIESEPGVGAVRTCHIAGFGPVKPGVIKERLVAFDPETMSFAYDAVEGMPDYVTRAVNRWFVYPRGNSSCVVRAHATLELRGAIRALSFLLKLRMQTDGARVLDDLRYHVENSKPHPRKVEATMRALRSGKG